MRTIVVGCGKLGSELAYRLFQHGHHVVVVDNCHESFNNLHPDFRGRTIEGDGISQSVMFRAGVKETDGIAVVTNSDVINAIIGRLAKIEYKIEKVAVRNCDPRWQAMHEAFELETVSGTLWGVGRIEELLRHSCFQMVYNDERSDLSVFELVVPQCSNQCKVISDILTSVDCEIISMVRESIRVAYDKDTVLVGGDVLHISTNSSGAKRLRSLFVPITV